MTPAMAAELFGAAEVPWWVAGGYALELFAGRSWRGHGDLDVLLLRRDQLVVQSVLAGWEWWAADPPGVLRPWEAGEVLPAAVHDIWCRPGAGSPWRIQVMLDEADGAEWVSRRSAAVRLPVDAVGFAVDGIPCLRPEIQLFYKAADPRDKDQADFSAVVGLLDTEQVQWLRRTLAGVYGDSHPWLDSLG